MKKNQIQENGGKFQVIVSVLCVIIFVVICYPLYFVIIASVSDPVYVSTGQVSLWPRNVMLKGYQMIMDHKQLWRSYLNTIGYTAIGTLFNLVITVPAAYVVSRKEFMPRRIVMFLMVFTMYFGGGLIPTYLVVKDLGLANTPWVFILPFALNVYNMIIMRTFFDSGLSEEMHESAVLDGCNDFMFLMRIALPLSKSVLSVIALYYAVAHWNDYFTGLIYIRDQSLQTLQVILRDILLLAENSALAGGAGYAVTYVENMRYGVIIVSTLPLMIVYPFIQKYFEKGVMLGAVKG